MYLEVVSPEATLFSGEVTSVTVPGANGSFQMLDHHAAIVSTLTPGTVKIFGEIQLPEETADRFTKSDGATLLELPHGGTVEMQNNKVILLAD